MCVEAPRIQEASGCAAPLDGRVLATVGPFEFVECPARFVGPEEEWVVALFRDGYGTALDARERAHAPAALVEALVYLARLEPPEGRDGDPG